MGRTLWASRRKTREQRLKAAPVSKALRAVRSALPEGLEMESDALLGKVWVGDSLVARRMPDNQMNFYLDTLAAIDGFDKDAFTEAWESQE